MKEVHESKPADWVLFGVSGDVPTAAKIEKACPFPVRNLAGKTTLDQLMDELSACDVLLTNDTGTMHLAAALGVPTVAIFGSTEPALTAPVGSVHRVVREKVDCSPCFLRECPVDYRCMLRIEPERITRELEALLPGATAVNS
jgi:ADP-heptose:LPS heptosyltransferase